MLLDRLIPENGPPYVHTCEGPDDMPAHAKTALTQTTLTYATDMAQPRESPTDDVRAAFPSPTVG